MSTTVVGVRGVRGQYPRSKHAGAQALAGICVAREAHPARVFLR